MKKLLFLPLLLFFSITASANEKIYDFSAVSKYDGIWRSIDLYNLGYALNDLYSRKQEAAFRELNSVPTTSDMFDNEVVLYNSGADYRFYSRINDKIKYITFNIEDSTPTFTSNVNINGYTKLGSDAPSIKCIVFSTMTAGVEGGFTQVIVGNAIISKIVGAPLVSVGGSSGSWNYMISPDHSTTGQQWRWYIRHDSSYYLRIQLHATESEDILDQPVSILIWYKE